MKVVKDYTNKEGDKISLGGVIVKEESKRNTRKQKDEDAQKKLKNDLKKHRFKLFLVNALFCSILILLGCSWYISIIPMVAHAFFYCFAFAFARWKKMRANIYWDKYLKKYGVINKKTGEIEIPMHVRMTHRKLIEQGKNISVD